jgi:tetratricopeptide (TPR) repeat protein
MNAAFERVESLRILGRLDDAEREAKKALAAEPQDADLLALLSRVLCQADRPAEGEAAASAAIALDPDNAFAHRRRAYNLTKLRRHDEAVEAARTSMSLAPHNWHAADSYAYALSNAGRLEEAELAAHRVVELAPDHAWSHFLVGSIKERRRQWVPAFRAYLEASRLDPENPEFRRRMAKLECRTGQVVRGLASHVEVARLDPGRGENLDRIFSTAQGIYRRTEFAICVATCVILGLHAILDWTHGARVGAAVVLGAGVIAVWRAARILPAGTGSLLWNMWTPCWYLFMVVPMCVVAYILVVVAGLDQLLYVALGLVAFEVLLFTMLMVYVNIRPRRGR